MQVLLFLHRLYFFVILNIRNKKTYKMKKIIFLFIISSLLIKYHPQPICLWKNLSGYNKQSDFY